MTDMTTYAMLDDVNLTIEGAHVTEDTKAIAGYVNGKYANWPAVVAKWGRAGLFLLSIDVQGNPAAGAQCFDIESGDGTIAQAPGWCKTTRANGVAAKDLRYFPKLYIQESNAETLVTAMAGAGIPRDTWLLWTAHYTGKQHICGPNTCGCPVQADATQWTSSADGVSLDESSCFGYFFAGPPDPKALAKLGKPAGLAAYPSYRGVDLTWTEVPGAKEYDVQLLKGSVQAGRTGVTGLKASLPVDPETAYTFRVAALPGGEWSEPVAFKTPMAPVRPVETVLAVKPPVPKPSTGTMAATVSEGVLSATGTATVSAAPSGSKSVLVYVQEILEADVAAKLGLPAGTIVFIPHTVEGA